jgi:hypothetical protein
MNETLNKRRTDEASLYCLGRIEQFIEDFAKSIEVPSNELAHRVCTLFQAQTNGQISRSAHNVSPLPDSRLRAGARNSASTVEVARGSHSGSPLKGYVYPKGTHWTQKPENRQKLLKQVRYAQALRAKKARRHASHR